MGEAPSGLLGGTGIFQAGNLIGIVKGVALADLNLTNSSIFE